MPEGWEIGLFFHFIGLAALAGGIALSVGTYVMMRRSQSVQEMRVWADLGRILGKYPITAAASVVLLLSGGYLVQESDPVWGWDDGWIAFSAIALIVAALVGALVISPRMKDAGAASGQAPDGPVPPGITQKLRDPLLFGAIGMNSTLMIGVLWNMVMKPGSFASLLTLVVLGAIGAAAAYTQMERE